MQRGTILFHKKFRFKNGTEDQKLLVVLNNQSGNDPFLIAKTTSQKKNKSQIPGCIEEDALFFITGGKTWFDSDTWIQLYEIYPFNAAELIKDRFDDELEIKDYLPTDMANAIKNCIKRLVDVEVRYKKMILKK